jgi:hypothetical protein
MMGFTFFANSISRHMMSEAKEEPPGESMRKTIAFTEGEIFDPEGRLVAKATATAMPTPFERFKRREGSAG